jgi:hypothetical protein
MVDGKPPCSTALASSHLAMALQDPRPRSILPLVRCSPSSGTDSHPDSTTCLLTKSGSSRLGIIQTRKVFSEARIRVQGHIPRIAVIRNEHGYRWSESSNVVNELGYWKFPASSNDMRSNSESMTYISPVLHSRSIWIVLPKKSSGIESKSRR